MTPEAQRIAIAKECGRSIPCVGYEPEKFQREAELPDYTSDLNAMHEAEKTLSEAHCYIYNQWLCKAAGAWTPRSKAVNWVFHATAAQRAEAFLRTMGLWKE